MAKNLRCHSYVTILLQLSVKFHQRVALNSSNKHLHVEETLRQLKLRKHIKVVCSSATTAKQIHLEQSNI